MISSPNLDPPLEELCVRRQAHLVLEVVRPRAPPVRLAVLARHQADEGHHLLVHEGAEADLEVGRDVLDGRGDLGAKFDLRGKNTPNLRI